ncbi:MAG: ribosome silencing factor [Planctomycetota bacterium]
MMTKTTTESDQLRRFVIEAAQLASDRHCEDVIVLDVRGLSQVCEYVLLASGTSDRQMRTVADELEKLGKEYNHPPFRSSVDSASTWIVVDFVDAVAHFFEPNQRAYYDLESLWSDAPTVPWQRSREETSSS